MNGGSALEFNENSWQVINYEYMNIGVDIK
mgnify:CR=1 FL=1